MVSTCMVDDARSALPAGSHQNSDLVPKCQRFFLYASKCMDPCLSCMVAERRVCMLQGDRAIRSAIAPKHHQFTCLPISISTKHSYPVPLSLFQASNTGLHFLLTSSDLTNSNTMLSLKHVLETIKTWLITTISAAFALYLILLHAIASRYIP